MSRSKQYLESLLSGVPLDELAAFEHRSTFQQIKDRIAGTEDVVGELTVLYRVHHFSDFALQLLWMAERAERDPSLLDATPEDQTLVLSAFRQAVGDTGIVAEQPMTTPSEEPVPVAPAMEAPSAFGTSEATTTEDPFGMPAQPEPTTATPSGFEGFSSPAQEEAPSGFGSQTESTPEPTLDFPTAPSPEPMADFPSAASQPDPMADFASFPSAEPEPAIPVAPPSAPPVSAPAAGEGSPETQFAQLVEQCVEAITTGAAERDNLKDRMLALCAGVLADSGAAEDYKNFCQVFTEFLNYIYENQFVDDIRVMNLLSNVTDPVWAWARADAASREGMMNAAYDTLREFKSLFE